MHLRPPAGLPTSYPPHQRLWCRQSAMFHSWLANSSADVSVSSQSRKRATFAGESSPSAGGGLPTSTASGVAAAACHGQGHAGRRAEGCLLGLADANASVAGGGS